MSWCGPVFALALVYLNIAIWGGFAALPPVMQIAATALFWLAAIILWVREFPRIRWPNVARVKSRLEMAGELPHQPLQTLSDQPIRHHPLSNVLWQHHQFSAAHDLARLRWPKLRADYALRDPFALRWLLLLFALLGALQHPDVAEARVRAAFFPTDLHALAQLGPSEFHLYITPPAHTRLDPVYYNRETLPAEIIMPQGSRIWLRVIGGGIKPKLTLGSGSHKLSRAQDQFFTLERAMDAGNRFYLRQGIFALADAGLRLVPDRAPVVSAPEIKELPRGKMQVKFCATDQYGLRSITLHWQGVENPDQQKSFSIRAPEDMNCITHQLNAGQDMFAGQKVMFWISAENTAGLRGETKKTEVSFPAYPFKNEWARQLAAARQAYLLDPQQQENLVQKIAELRKLKLPVGLYLALQNAARDLNSGRGENAAADLWQVVMRIEEGIYADIAANWRGRQNELLDAVSNWRVSENHLRQMTNETAEAWRAFAPAWGYDGAVFDGAWNHIIMLVVSGDRNAAAQMIRQFDNDPGELLDGQKWKTINPNGIEALTDIRQRLNDPQLTHDERDYLERLLQP